MIYKVTPKSQSFIVKTHLWALFYLALIYLIAKYMQPENYLWEIGLSIGFVVVDLIPSLSIHLQYLHYNAHLELEVNKLNRTMRIANKGKEHTFGFDEIHAIHLRLMPELYRKQKGVFFPWEWYHYAVIELENGEKFIITSLLINDMREFFKTNYELPSRWEKTYFPLI